MGLKSSTVSEIASPLDFLVSDGAPTKCFPRIFLARAEPFRLAGERVFLRLPERGDYEDCESTRPFPKFFSTLGAELARRRAEPGELPAPEWPAMPKTGEPTKLTTC